jgi:hypothetical protein
MEKELAELVDIYFEQANVFSALVGIFGTRALDSFTNYEKHRHAHTAQQWFPDLCRRGCKPQPNHCLESTGSKRPWAIQSHYDHPGWYILWRYPVDRTESFEAGKPIITWRVDVVFLEKQGTPEQLILVRGARPRRSSAWRGQHFPFLGFLPPPKDGWCDITDLYVARYGVPKPNQAIWIRTCQHIDGFTDVPKTLRVRVPPLPA